jgi:subtilisin family serine protease
MRRSLGKLLLLGWFALGAAQAQLAPQVQVPAAQVPPIRVPGVSLPEVGDALTHDVHALTGTRTLRIEKLAREHRELLDRDAHGDLVVRAEVVAVDITEDTLKRALAENFLLKRTQELGGLGVKISVLQTPQGWSASRGLKRLRKLDPQGTYDFNHVYLDSETRAAGLPNAQHPVDAPADAGTRAAQATRRVGLIDGGVDVTHADFTGIRFQHFGCDGQQVPSAHGTSVADILVSRHSVDEIYAADVYCGSPAGGAIDAIAGALAWLARERVAVINVSLVGPRNALLERVVSALVTRGFVIVAAVGNDGPAAPPLYPASYNGVIGVTGVDKHHRVLFEAGRGKQVFFAAAGADVQAATKAPDGRAPVRGTSFAAPVVASLLASEFQSPDPAQRDRELARWISMARDLGKPGPDEIYGHGELGDAGPAMVGGANK